MTRSWMKKVVFAGAVAGGLVFASGCETGLPGSVMGRSMVGDKTIPDSPVHTADNDRSGPSDGMRIVAAPTIHEGSHYQYPAGSMVPPPVQVAPPLPISKVAAPTPPAAPTPAAATPAAPGTTPPAPAAPKPASPGNK